MIQIGYGHPGAGGRFACALLGALLLGGCAGMPMQSEPRTTAMPAAYGREAAATSDLAALRGDAANVVAGLRWKRDGKVYSGAVEGTNPDDLTVSVALVDGRAFSVGKTDARFPLMSVSKPFTYALSLEQRGVEFMVDKIGVSATGMPYNSVAAGAVRRTSEQNPMVNAGAIATHGYIEGSAPDEKIGAVVDLYSKMANRPLAIEEAWRATPRALTYTLAYQMKSVDRLEGDVDDVTNRYLESNIVAVGAEDLAQMGATFASGGIQPVTGERILKRETVRTVLSASVIAGMYEDSGLWWTRVGLPAKSGVSGAIVAIAPGWGAIVAYSPRLDAAGNSVRGAIAIEQLVDRWQLHSIDRLIGAP